MGKEVLYERLVFVAREGDLVDRYSFLVFRWANNVVACGLWTLEENVELVWHVKRREKNERFR